MSGIFFALLFGGIFYPPAAAAVDDDDDDDDADDDDGVKHILGFPYWWPQNEAAFHIIWQQEKVGRSGQSWNETNWGPRVPPLNIKYKNIWTMSQSARPQSSDRIVLVPAKPLKATQ